MGPLRSSPLLLAFLLLRGSACSKSDPGVSKAPDSSTAEISVKGIETSSLTPRERREWAAQVSELLAPCANVPVSIAQCINDARPCKSCLPAAQLLLKQVQAGRAKKDREEAFHARFDAAKVRTLSTDGSPEIGSPDAVVTIIEWADFECPFCRLVSPLLDQLVKRYPTQVRLVYKFYPLGGHPHGEISARAAVASIEQGKFWEMHHMLFENQDALEPANLEQYAKQLGLDLPKFHVALTSKETNERLERDKKQADGVGLEGTPFIFINGRKVDLQLLANPEEDLSEWVKLEIELSGQVPKPVGSSGAKAGAAPPAAPGSASAGSPSPASPAPSGKR